MGYSLGIDLGTTFVAAAVARDGKVEMCGLGEGALISPAAVFVTDDGGTLTGEPALRQGLNRPDRLAHDLRRRLGDPAPVLLGGRPHTPAELLGTLLRRVVQVVSAREGAAPDQVVLARPAGWDRSRQEAYATVPGLAGLPRVALLTEPEAVAAHYSATRALPEHGLVALYSLGGGTFEVTLARPGPGGLEFVGAPRCLELGGIDFDQALVGFVDRAVGGVVGALDPAEPGTARALARLRTESTQAKEALSGDDEAVVPVQLGAVQRDARVTRADFEHLITPAVAATLAEIGQALRSAQASPADLAGILLVGGSTRIPLVTRMLRRHLGGRPVWTNVHPKHAVALGAAATAARLTGQPVNLPSPAGALPQPAGPYPPPAAAAGPYPPPAAAAGPYPPAAAAAPYPSPAGPHRNHPAPPVAPPPPHVGRPYPPSTPEPHPYLAHPTSVAGPYPPPPARTAEPYPARAGEPPRPVPPVNLAGPYPPPAAPTGHHPPPVVPHARPIPDAAHPGSADDATDDEWQPTSHWPRLVGGVVLLAMIVVVVLVVFAVLTRIRP